MCHYSCILSWVLQLIISDWLKVGWEKPDNRRLFLNRSQEKHKVLSTWFSPELNNNVRTDPPFAATNPEKHVMRPPSIFQSYDILMKKKKKSKNIQILTGTRGPIQANATQWNESGCSLYDRKRAETPHKPSNAQEHLAPNCSWSQFSFKRVLRL